MEYQIQMVYEKEDVGAMVRAMEYRRQPEKNLRLATKIAYPIFGILLIIVAIGTIAAMLTAALVSIATIVVMVASMVGGVALLRRSDSRGMERRSWKRYPNKGLTLTYTFYNDHFEEVDEVSGENTYQYISIASANEDDNHFFLFTASNAGHMLRKDCFLVGDPATFGKFIRIKAAVTIDPIQ